MGKINTIKSFFFRLIAVLAGILAALLLLEVLLRVIGPEYYRYSNRSFEYYTNPRGYHDLIREENGRKIYGLRVYFDKYGYRLPDNRPELHGKQPPPPGGLLGENTILALGDSFTFGTGVRYNDMYLNLLGKMLNSNGYPAYIKNAARPGDDLERIVKIHYYETSMGKYDLVIYGFMLNDFGLPGLDEIGGFEFIDYNDPRHPYNPLRKKIRLYNFVMYLLEKRKLHNVTSKIYIKAYEGEHAEKKFKLLKNLDVSSRRSGQKLIIVLFPILYDFSNYPFQGIHDKIRDFCEKEGIVVIDLLPVFSEYSADELWVNPTDHHPNELANRLTAETLYTFLTDNRLVVKEPDGRKLKE